MRILIAGARGQLGRCMMTPLSVNEVIALDRSALDVTDLAQVGAVLSSHTPDLVINASAYNDVDGAEAEQSAAFMVNAQGPRNLALVTAALNIPLLQVSTDYVFDGKLRKAYDEFCETNPLSVYGRSKLAGEENVRSLNPRHYIVRTAWLFWEQGRNFLLSMYRSASRPEVSVVADTFGSPTYVPHLAEAINRLIRTKAYGTYHLAGRGGASRWELVIELYRMLGIRRTVTPVPQSSYPSAARRPEFSVLTTASQPRIELPPWQQGVATFVRRVRTLRLAEA